MMAKTETRTIDVCVTNKGTVFTFDLLTGAAREWVDENVETETWQWLGCTLAVDPRRAEGLTGCMIEAGLEVE